MSEPGRAEGRLLIGDALETLRTLPAESVHCCVCSPPYFGLRSYLSEGHPKKPKEIGLEQTPAAYVARLVEIFREVRRILHREGTLWIVLGDSYACGGNGPRDASRGPKPSRNDHAPAHMKRRTGLKPKDLIGIPWMTAFALRDDGWWLRSDICWAKPAPMPERVTDRPTSSHEHVFLFAKKALYYYDPVAVAEPAVSIHRSGNGYKRPARLSCDGREGDETPPADTRNLRDVWRISTEAYSGAHFGVYPPALIVPCILAGTSAHGHCPACGAGWRRVVEKGRSAWEIRKQSGEPLRAGRAGMGSFRHMNGRMMKAWKVANPDYEMEWRPGCRCDLPPEPAVVLDPFAGSGTTLSVAVGHGRHALGIELNAEYAPLVQQRLGMFLSIEQQAAREEEADPCAST